MTTAAMDGCEFSGGVSDGTAGRGGLFEWVLHGEIEGALLLLFLLR